MEADPRHSELITEQTPEYDLSKGHREVMTLGIDVGDDNPEMKIELDGEQARTFRNIARAACI